MSDSEHWQSVYGKKGADSLSWFRSHLDRSLAFIEECELPKNARIVDVGGGASTLVDDLCEAGYSNLAVMDLADSGLALARERLGAKAEGVDWLVGDATSPLLEAASVDFWHDRAVFHFLSEPASRQAYLEQVTRCLKPGGHLMVATFALDGPDKCSGLPVQRYDAEGIVAAFGRRFEKVAEAAEIHHTPGGRPQSFVYCLCRFLA